MEDGGEGSEQVGSPLVPDELHQTGGILVLGVDQTEVSQSLLLLPLLILGHPRPPLLQLVVSQLFGVIPSHWYVIVIIVIIAVESPYFSKLLTMMGRGSDMVRAPLMAQNVPTSLPTPLTG